MSTALVILAPGFEETEAVAPIDILRRGAIDVTVSAVEAPREVVSQGGLTVVAEALLADVQERTFDLIVLPGGVGHKVLRASAPVLDLLRRQHAAGRWIGAICAAPAVLKEAGLLPERYTAHFSVAEELAALDRGAIVVRDGTIVTSQGAGTATRFGLALVEALQGRAKAEEIAEAVCLNVPLA